MRTVAGRGNLTQNETANGNLATEDTEHTEEPEPPIGHGVKVGT